MSYDPRSSHLFVLIHGLWGTPEHMESLRQSFKAAMDPRENAVFLLPSRNAKFKTFDGIEILGYRVLLEVCQFIQQYNEDNKDGRQIRRISVIGYSLGGLVARFVAGKMFTECREYFRGIEPALFLTMATPHIGIKFFNPQHSLWRSITNPVLTFLGSNALGKSGRELFITNSYNDTLVRLSSGEFTQGLARFQRRVVCANVKNDRTVAFYTAFVSEYDPFIDTQNRLNYTFEQGVPGTGYSGILPRIVDMDKLDPADMRVVVRRPRTLKQKLALYVMIPCLLVVFFPIALIVNISGTIYRHVATSRYRRMIRDGDLPSEFRERIGISSRLTRYVSETYESIVKESDDPNDALNNDVGDDDDDEDDDNLSMGPGQHIHDDKASIVAAEQLEDEKWNTFIDKYSSVMDPRRDWLGRFKKLPFDEKRKLIVRNLSELEWIRVPLYVKSINSHGGIVARRGMNEDAPPTSIAAVEFVGKLVSHLASSLH